MVVQSFDSIGSSSSKHTTMNISYTPNGYPSSKVTLGRESAKIKMDAIEIKTTYPSYSISIEIFNRPDWEEFLEEEGFSYEVNHDIITINYIRTDEIIWIGHRFMEWQKNK